MARFCWNGNRRVRLTWLKSRGYTVEQQHAWETAAHYAVSLGAVAQHRYFNLSSRHFNPGFEDL
jgi:hypothetical protein